MSQLNPLNPLLWKNTGRPSILALKWSLRDKESVRDVKQEVLLWLVSAKKVDKYSCNKAVDDR